MSVLQPFTLPLQVLVALLVSACLAPPPGSEIAVISTSPDSIEVWGRNQVPNAIGPQIPWASERQMTEVAQGHCGDYGRGAVKVSQRIAGAATIVKFRCADGIGTSTVPEVPANQASSQSEIQFEIVNVADGAINAATSTAIQSAQRVKKAFPSPQLSPSFGVEFLGNSTRTSEELVMRCIIANNSNRQQPIPPVSVNVLNATGELVGYTVIGAPGDPLAGGQDRTFELRIRNLPADATQLILELISPA